jgi:hypothetical protein
MGSIFLDYLKFVLNEINSEIVIIIIIIVVIIIITLKFVRCKFLLVLTCFESKENIMFYKLIFGTVTSLEQ